MLICRAGKEAIIDALRENCTASVEYLHVAYLPKSGGWVRDIVSEVCGAKSRRLQCFAESWPKSPLFELGLAVTTKLAMLGYIIKLLDQLHAELCKEAETLSDLPAHINRGAGFLPKDRELPYRLLVAIDAFIYEFRSTYEIVGKFVRGFSKTFLGKDLTEGKLICLLREAGIDDAWISDLRCLRVDFFHKTAPWLALEITARSPFHARLVLLRSNVRDPLNADGVVRFDRLQLIYRGFEKSLRELRRLLIARFKEHDAVLVRGVSS